MLTRFLISGHLPHPRSLLQGDISAYAAKHHAYEKLGIGALLRAGTWWCSISVCLWLYSPACHSTPRRHESDDQGLCLLIFHLFYTIGSTILCRLSAHAHARLQESYKQVYNWQFVHCVDFWTLVLARACSRDALQAAGRESGLQALIYPLVQVSLGAIQ
jgi:Noc2p family